MLLIQTAALFVLTALAEIVGCFLPYLWLRKDGSIWLLVPAALSLAAFVWLLTLHPAASGRVYAAYGGVYVATGPRLAEGRGRREALRLRLDWSRNRRAWYGGYRLWLDREGVNGRFLSHLNSVQSFLHKI